MRTDVEIVSNSSEVEAPKALALGARRLEKRAKAASRAGRALGASVPPFRDLLRLFLFYSLFH